jgi:two-component system, OmpR family, response regulator
MICRHPNGTGNDGRGTSSTVSSASGLRWPTRVLLVDDDCTMRRMIVNYFEGYDIQVIPASRSAEAVQHLAISVPNLIVLDLRLGDEDGLDLLRQIRSHSDIPIIITTGQRCDEIDRVVGLELGADDYVTKPFNLRELLARVRAVLRRQHFARRDAQRDTTEERLNFGGWQLDRRSRRLTDSNGMLIHLTKGEFGLLTAFLDAPQRLLTREHLLQTTRLHKDIFDRSIDVQVLRLRQRLEIDPAKPQIIQTERGIGYIFTLPVERR